MIRTVTRQGCGRRLTHIRRLRVRQRLEPRNLKASSVKLLKRLRNFVNNLSRHSSSKTLLEMKKMP